MASVSNPYRYGTGVDALAVTDVKTSLPYFFFSEKILQPRMLEYTQRNWSF